MTERTLARALVAEGLTEANRAELVARGGKSFGKLWAFGDEEARALSELQGAVTTWLSRPGPERPLCVALFGPPGAGKSFTFAQLLTAFEARGERPHWARSFRTFVFNLTQFESSAEVAQSLAAVPRRVQPGEMPVVFFDEFDAPRGARDLGWLPWFLAPMQDGEWELDGQTRTLRQAIYVFAGGTSPSFADFQDDGTDPDAARRAKRPDFVSRLRGTLDIAGPDADPAPIRRALVLYNQLAAYNATWLGAAGFVRKSLPDAQIDRLLRVKRFIHGARSIGALLDACVVEPGDATLDLRRVPRGVWDAHVEE